MSNDSFVVSIPKTLYTHEQLVSILDSKTIPENAISWAAENGDKEIVEKCIALGANIRENCNYPLELACKNGHKEIVKLLLRAGAKTADSKKDKGYCLRLASWNGYFEIVKMLLDADADPQADNYNALLSALEQGHMNIVNLLLDTICKLRSKPHVKKITQKLFLEFAKEQGFYKYLVFDDKISNIPNRTGLAHADSKKWLVYDVDNSGTIRNASSFTTKEKAFEEIAYRFHSSFEYNIFRARVNYQ